MSAQPTPGEGELDKLVPRSFVERLADDLAGSVTSIFGEPVERDGITVIPVAKARWAMRGGSGSQRKSGDEHGPELGIGGGGGVVAKPVGFIELSSGRAKFRPIRAPGPLAWVILASGLVGLSALQTIVGARRPRRAARLRFGSNRLARRLRHLFR